VKRHGSDLGFFSWDTSPPIIMCCDCGKTVSDWNGNVDLDTDECIPTRLETEIVKIEGKQHK
jgi:hypothetical protein